MKLYELDNEYLDFIAAVEDGTIPEDAIEDTSKCSTATTRTSWTTPFVLSRI